MINYLNMKKKIALLRFCYWTGAVLDALTVIPMLSSQLGGRMFGIANFNPAAEYKYAMGLGATLMLGWTFLLIWADRRPIERKGVLILTVCPVLAGLFLSGIYAVNSGMISAVNMIPMWIIQITIASLYSFSYFYTNSLRIKE